MNLTSAEVSIFSLFLKLELFWINNKAITEFGVSQDMKNSADLGGCYPPPPSASADNNLIQYSALFNNC